MKTAIFALVWLLGAGGAASANVIFTSTLSGAQEVPPNASTASGSASLVLNDAMDRLEISISISGLDLDGAQTPAIEDDVVGAHIHRGVAGVNGPIVFGFIGPNNDTNMDLAIDAAAGTIFSAWDLMEGNAGTTLAAELDALLTGGLYINVHTTAFPAGEIRGQILAAPLAVAEPPILALAGMGLAWLVLTGRRPRPGRRER